LSAVLLEGKKFSFSRDTQAREISYNRPVKFKSMARRGSEKETEKLRTLK